VYCLKVAAQTIKGAKQSCTVWQLTVYILYTVVLFKSRCTDYKGGQTVLHCLAAYCNTVVLYIVKQRNISEHTNPPVLGLPDQKRRAVAPGCCCK